MSESKFTPGPWRVCDECAYGWDINQDTEKYNWLANVHNNELLHEPQSEEEGLANARLIAAAPDMYEALKAVLEDVQFMIEHGYIGDVMDDILYVHARAAIAKADGIK